MPYHYIAGILGIGILLLVYDIYLIYIKNFSHRVVPKLGYGFIILSSLIYIISFVTDNFTLVDVYRYSSSSQSLMMKLSSSWSSDGGFIIWWIMISSLFLLIHRIIRLRGGIVNAGESNYIKFFSLSNVFIVFLGASLYTTDSLRAFEGCCNEGLGLNPLLRNFWNFIHPPFVFLGYSLTVLAAISAISNLTKKEINFYASLGWITISIANIVGGIWSYNTLGWGGYWVWDPVETALLLPWLALTGYFHLSYLNHRIQYSILSLSGFSIFFAAYVTRGGLYSPLHGFAVSSTGVVSMILMIPFLFYALNTLRDMEFNGYKDVFNDVYKGSITISGLSILGIYIVLLTILASQSIYSFFTDRALALDISIYNYLSLPFTAIFLAFFPGCNIHRYFRDIFDYVKRYAVPSLAISGVFSLTTPFTGIYWSPISSIYTNMIINFLIPLALSALMVTLYGLGRIFFVRIYGDLGLKILHTSVPLMILAILFSGPYTYNQGYFIDGLAERDNILDLGGIEIVYRGAEFRGLVGRVSIPAGQPMADLPVIPEESVAILYFEVLDGGNKYIVSGSARFNFGNILKGHGGLIIEPIIISKGLDEYYIVPSSMSVVDLIYLYGMHAYSLANTSTSDIERFVYSHITVILADMLGIDNELFRNHSISWSSDKALMQSGILISYKKIPLIKLLYISFALLIIGEVIHLLDRWLPKSIIREEVNKNV